MVFQSYALFPHMRVFENIRYGLEVGQLSAAEINERVSSIMRITGLEALGDRYPHELSGGQQQRVAVARALVIEPQVLLFDEPLSNLDAKLRRKVRQEIRDLQQSLGLTVIYVTHDQEEALAISDTIVVLNNAVVAQVGSPRELYEQPRTQFVADFIGEANILPCELTAGVGGVTVTLGPMRFELPSVTGRQGAGHIAVQPGKIELRSADQPSDGHPNMPGTLSKVSYLGDHLECVVTTPLGEILVHTPATVTPLTGGTDIVLSIPPSAVVLLDD
jgi:iron(III) transport system ATP-binding protein